MKSVGAFLISAVLMLSLTVFLVYFRLSSSWPEEKSGVVTAIETRSVIPDQYPSGSDLRQNDSGGPNHSVYIDNAIKKTLRDPDSFKFISATLWTQDFPGYGRRAWICQAEYRTRKAFGGYGLPEEIGIIFDTDGCRVLNALLEKEPNAMTASKRKTLMYTIKTIHDPSNNAQGYIQKARMAQ